MTSTESIKFVVAMIIMMNPLGSLSIFLDLTKKSTVSLQRNIALRTSISILILMIMAVWSGKEILSLFGITISSFRFAGGIILLLIGLNMLQSKESPLSYTSEDDEAAKERHSVAIVPMALPVIIGPGAISTLIIVSGDHSSFSDKVWVSLLCFILTICMSLILLFAVPIARFIGTSIIKVVTRIMGMIIMAIAVGMLATGLIGLIPALQ